jgi:hypothetical protein
MRLGIPIGLVCDSVRFLTSARMLQEIADSWDRLAEREDERARQDQMRFE